MHLAWGVTIGGKARLGNAPVTLGAVVGSGLVRGTWVRGYGVSSVVWRWGGPINILRANVVVSVFKSGVVLLARHSD